MDIFSHILVAKSALGYDECFIYVINIYIRSLVIQAKEEYNGNGFTFLHDSSLTTYTNTVVLSVWDC